MSCRPVKEGGASGTAMRLEFAQLLHLGRSSPEEEQWWNLQNRDAHLGFSMQVWSLQQKSQLFMDPSNPINPPEYLHKLLDLPSLIAIQS